MPRCPKGTRRNKKSGNCEPKKASTRCPKGTRRNKKTGDCERQRGKKGNTLISTENLDDIIDSVQLNPEKRLELEAMKPQLKNMKYDPSYISCFTGKKTRDLIHMIETKIQCWAKYGDDI
jgi:hypothetical protein